MPPINPELQAAATELSQALATLATIDINQVLMNDDRRILEDAKALSQILASEVNSAAQGSPPPPTGSQPPTRPLARDAVKKLQEAVNHLETAGLSESDPVKSRRLLIFELRAEELSRNVGIAAGRF